MATMQDITKLRFDHVLDLRDWDLHPSAGLIGALDLRRGTSGITGNFFEVMPGYVANSLLVPSEASFKVPVNTEDNVDKARFMVILGVVLAIAALGLLATAIVMAARTLTL